MVRAKTERAAGMRTMVAGLLAALVTESLRPAATGLAHAANFTVTNTKPSSTPSKDQTGYFLGRPGPRLQYPHGTTRGIRRREGTVARLVRRA